jgi:succinyl-CoA synthetase alpha subunit
MVVGHMQAFGTSVVAGVTPGKGGSFIGKVPVYDSVREAAEAIGVASFDVSIVYVPPLAVLDAASEAIAARTRLLVVVTEHIPQRDVAHLLLLAREHHVTIIGPNTVGLINPAARIKLGPIGGDRPIRSFVPGRIGIISRSGGMTAELGLQLRLSGLGVSTAISVGGDAMLGLPPACALRLFENDPDTDAVLLFGEPGTTHEEEVANAIGTGSVRKPLVAYIAGMFTESMPRGTMFGHAGAIIEGDAGRPSAKVARLRQAGAYVAERLDDLVPLLRATLAGRDTGVAL